MNISQAPVAQAVTVSLKDLENGTVSFDTLIEAFGPSSLGIIVVKDLPENFVQLRAQVLSNASYLAALPKSELGRSKKSVSFSRPSSLSSRSSSWSQFTDRPAPEPLESPESKYLVGWSCGKETLKSGTFDTLKGSYYVNCAFYQDPALQSAPADGFPNLPQYTAPNIWPPSTKLPAFRSSVESLCSLIIDTAALVAKACDQYAEANIEDYKPGYLEHVVTTSLTTKARLLHYFPANASLMSTEASEANVDDDDWCATHVDHGCLTGLTSAMFLDEAASLPIPDPDPTATLPELTQSPDPSAGLYIRSRTGSIVKVNIPKDCLAFQTGEALELITRGKFQAVPHFVKGAKCPGGKSRIARNTLAVFTQPNLAEEVEPGLTFAEFARRVVQKNY
ncbi:hypothetical protein N7462_007383 [Penicillium macrosclerotiorum]|uniref:uncharacterized protein n=1 Tax=Penicillium macrosclerotiorum TaxID=303699 RepID=UPI0025499D1C|nr:uncharacterized protein N7462_007383 [Penicillium macrosclerotiorum]KAJ5679139.1 hypothetical protein N7462_007383 [Penicillium macrosclerotiorum]